MKLGKKIRPSLEIQGVWNEISIHIESIATSTWCSIFDNTYNSVDISIEFFKS